MVDGRRATARSKYAAASEAKAAAARAGTVIETMSQTIWNLNLSNIRFDVMLGIATYLIKSKFATLIPCPAVSRLSLVFVAATLAAAAAPVAAATPHAHHGDSGGENNTYLWYGLYSFITNGKKRGYR
jgi:hypothetical protein